MDIDELYRVDYAVGRRDFGELPVMPRKRCCFLVQEEILIIVTK